MSPAPASTMRQGLVRTPRHRTGRAAATGMLARRRTPVRRVSAPARTRWCAWHWTLATWPEPATRPIPRRTRGRRRRRSALPATSTPRRCWGTARSWWWAAPTAAVHWGAQSSMILQPTHGWGRVRSAVPARVTRPLCSETARSWSPVASAAPGCRVQRSTILRRMRGRPRVR
jgi:hypothetical protein